MKSKLNTSFIIKMQTNSQIKLKEKNFFFAGWSKISLGLYLLFLSIFTLYIFFVVSALLWHRSALLYIYTINFFFCSVCAMCAFSRQAFFRFSYSLFNFRCRLSNALTMSAWLKLHHTAVCSYATTLNVCSNQRLKSKTNVNTIWSHYYRKKAQMKKKRKKVHSTNLMKLNSQPLKFTFPFQAKHSFFIAL